MSKDKDFSDIFHAKNDLQINFAISRLSTDALLDLRAQALDNIDTQVRAARFS